MDSLYDEMLCQKALQGRHCYTFILSRHVSPYHLSLSFIVSEHELLYKLCHHNQCWSTISFYLNILINILVAFFHPFSKGEQYLSES